ncbi:MAG: WD40/YVTN/BNR-like repeat-containing protein, partial [Ignavibacteriales bacterium]
MVLRKFTIIIISVFIAVSSLNFAQWESTSGPEAGHITTISNFNSNIFCGTQRGDIFSSNDNGASWIETGSVQVEVNEQLNTIAGNSTTLFAGTFKNLFRSTDSGISWSSLLNNIYVNELISLNENIYAATGRGVYTTTDNGSTWQNLTANLPDTNVTAIESFGSDLFVAVLGNAVYKSTNNGASWDSAKTGLTSDQINFLSSDDTNLYAAFSGKAEIFRSTNGGLNWSKADLIGGNSTFESVLSLFASPSGIYAGVIFQGSIFSSISGGIYKSTDEGITWNLHTSGLTNKYIRSLFSDVNTFIAGTQGGGIFRSSDEGLNWIPSSDGMKRADVRHIAYANNGADFFGGVYGGGFFTSNDSGKTWDPSNIAINFSAFPTVTQFIIK